MDKTSHIRLNHAIPDISTPVKTLKAFLMDRGATQRGPTIPFPD